MITLLVFQLVVLIFSVMIHEVSHGYVADYLGDPTARNAGRLNFNPLNHLDPFGSVILPLILSLPLLFGQPAVIFGWAKPVPYNPNNLRNPKVSAAKIAAAGPISNVLVALVIGIFLRVTVSSGAVSPFLGTLLAIIVYLNILLAIFNLVPLPPLDGSKVLFALLPVNESSYNFMRFLERYGMILVLVFIFFGFQLIVPVINAIFSFIVGGAGGQLSGF